MTTEKGGKPTWDYDPALGDEICHAISTSTDGLKKLCQQNPHWPSDKHIYSWLIKHTEFSSKYAQAKAAQQELLVNQMLEISADRSKDMYLDKDGNLRPNMAAIARDKLIADNIKWTASRLTARYRDKQVIEQHNVTHETSIKDLE